METKDSITELLGAANWEQVVEQYDGLSETDVEYDLDLMFTEKNNGYLARDIVRHLYLDSLGG